MTERANEAEEDVEHYADRLADALTSLRDHPDYKAEVDPPVPTPQ